MEIALARIRDRIISGALGLDTSGVFCLLTTCCQELALDLNITPPVLGVVTGVLRIVWSVISLFILGFWS